jgi:TRAP-type C4-dicarboxylate transport system substrate-binding protein
VQRCPFNPQEKRSTCTGKEIKTPNGIKEIKIRTAASKLKKMSRELLKMGPMKL